MRLLLALLVLAVAAADARAQVDTTPPTAVLTVPAVVEAGTVIPLSGTSSSDVGGEIQEYRWTVGPRPVVNTADPTFNAPGLPPGTYQVSLVVVDDAGLESAPDTESILVRDTVAPTAALTVPAFVNANTAIPLSGTGSADNIGSIEEYRWTVASRPVVVTADATFSAPGLLPGSYTASLVVVDDAGNESAPAAKSFTVRDTIAPVAVLTAPATAEVGAPIPLSGTSSSDAHGKVKEYRWTVGARPVVVTADPAFTAPGLAAGSYPVSLKVIDDSGNESAASTRTVVVRDTKAPIAVLTAPSSAVTGTTIALSGTGSTDVGGRIVEYRWTVGSRPVVATPGATFNAPGLTAGTYTLRLVVVDDAGNESAAATRQITVSGTKITKFSFTTLVAPVGERRSQLTLDDGVLLAGRVVSPEAARVKARFSARIGRRVRSLGRTAVDVPAGGFAQLKVTLSPALRRALAGRRKLKVVARVTVDGKRVRRVLRFEVR